MFTYYPCRCFENMGCSDWSRNNFDYVSFDTRCDRISNLHENKITCNAFCVGTLYCCSICFYCNITILCVSISLHNLCCNIWCCECRSNDDLQIGERMIQLKPSKILFGYMVFVLAMALVFGLTATHVSKSHMEGFGLLLIGLVSVMIGLILQMIANVFHISYEKKEKEK